ncbi:unnamed protein product [Musa hybrid cultivar]
MDYSVSPTEHICYVRCSYCNTVLKVGVPSKRMIDTVTVRCGHCDHLSFLCPSDHQMALQETCTDYIRGIPLSLPPPPPSSSSSLREQIIQKPPFVMKPPEKKHRMPSAYNRFMREEIQRIKAAKPDIPHREAFSKASKNWARCDPRRSTSVSISGAKSKPASVPQVIKESSCPIVESSSIYKQMEQKE